MCCRLYKPGTGRGKAAFVKLGWRKRQTDFFFQAEDGIRDCQRVLMIPEKKGSCHDVWCAVLGNIWTYGQIYCMSYGNLKGAGRRLLSLLDAGSPESACKGQPVIASGNLHGI